MRRSVPSLTHGPQFHPNPSNCQENTIFDFVRAHSYITVPFLDKLVSVVWPGLISLGEKGEKEKKVGKVLGTKLRAWVDDKERSKEFEKGR